MGWRGFLLAAVAVQAACGVECPEGASVYFDPARAERGTQAESWLAFPFPSDLRRNDDGRVDFDDFPDPNDVGLLADYTYLAGRDVGGFATNGAVYVAFTDPINSGSLSREPATFATASSPIQLIDITPTSPEYGLRRPLRWEYWGNATDYNPSSTIAVAPEWGFPMRESTTYAMIMTQSLKLADGGEMVQPAALTFALVDECFDACIEDTVDEATRNAFRDSYAPLNARLEEEGFDESSIIMATIFTTQAITPELVALRQFVHDDLPAPAHMPAGWQEVGGMGVYFETLDFEYNSGGDMVQYYRMEGRYESPNFQFGMLPYSSRGGAFRFENGKPTVSRTEALRFVLTIPNTPPADAGNCYPIVQYAHGTGGDAYGFSDSTGGRLAQRGLAAIGIDQPLHGMRKDGRSFDENMASFNFLNPDSARANFRQSSADTFSLTRFVRESLTVPANVSPTGNDICFDPSRVFFFGHSHGGLTGSMAAVVETDIPTWVLSGAGGGLPITIMERKDILDFEATVRLLLELGPMDRLTELHPAMSVIQTLVEITDPINYSPFWLGQSGFNNGQNMLITSGLGDEATPFLTANALAVAARIPAVEPLPNEIDGYTHLGLAAETAPVAANVSTRTAGFLQWGFGDGGDATHFVIFRRPEAINASMRFLQSAAYEGGAVIERDPGSDAR